MLFRETLRGWRIGDLMAFNIGKFSCAEFCAGAELRADGPAGGWMVGSSSAGKANTDLVG